MKLLALFAIGACLLNEAIACDTCGAKCTTTSSSGGCASGKCADVSCQATKTKVAPKHESQSFEISDKHPRINTKFSIEDHHKAPPSYDDHSRVKKNEERYRKNMEHRESFLNSRESDFKGRVCGTVKRLSEQEERMKRWKEKTTDLPKLHIEWKNPEFHKPSKPHVSNPNLPRPHPVSEIPKHPVKICQSLDCAKPDASCGCKKRS